MHDLLGALAVADLGRLVLPDYRPFVPIVARAYLARPPYEPAVVGSWVALAQHVEVMFRQLQSRVRVEFVGEDPYPDFESMERDVSRSGVMRVWTGASEHAAWPPETNWQFRAVHDFVVHLGGDHGFSLRGEMGAYNRHVKIALPAAWLALFTEVVGQVCAFHFLGRFAEQKIAALYGFDYVNVGAVDPQEYLRNGAGAVG